MCIRDRDIATGALLPGDKLLSVRDFAKQAKTNPNTVQRAYTELERIGVVETQRGQGTFVSYNSEIAREVRSEMTSSTVQSFVKEMRRLRYSDSDILALVSQPVSYTHLDVYKRQITKGVSAGAIKG